MDSTHPQIHPCIITHSTAATAGIGMYLHMHTHSYTFTTDNYCCIQILLLFYSVSLTKLTYISSQAIIFKYFIIICYSVATFDIVNRVVSKSWLNVLHHLVHERILHNYYPDNFHENCFSSSPFWCVVQILLFCNRLMSVVTL